MISLTEKEREALLILLKDFTAHYNANPLSKVLGISHVGCQKILKRLLKAEVITDERIGKAIIYEVRLEADYTTKLLSFLLADESNDKAKRWQEEFNPLFKRGRIVMLFGSILKNEKSARDIDMMLVIKKEDFKEIKKIIHEKQEVLPKKIHSIELTEQDLINNIKKKNPAIVDIIRNAIVLYGQDKYVEVMKNVRSV